ncbi:hypothetical protein [Paenibacillus spongiae]|uniref:Uncharacterized protein n=1 Tax=Paenibacillus spongiae TaxID=2909671 RepID=A0ABY5SBV1_9BACL|nr:hypothetical protein [Paenibacillus spongiae]UVI30220.1 hypothetical protein L1F29_33465 [Paenibacillus spongiae]
MDNYQQKKEKPKTYQHSEWERPPADENDAYQERQRTAPGGNPPPAKEKNKHRFWIGMTALLTFILFLFFNESTGKLEDVRSNGVGKGLQAGAVLAVTDDSAGLEPKDYEIQMKENISTSRMLIWDFAAEDGDVVTVKVNGTILATNIGIFHKPAVFDIPVPSVVEILGIKDGGGGITYGVKFPGGVQNNAYFNAAPVGSANKYTITGQ